MEEEEYGYTERIPPNSVEAETCVLGSMIFHSPCIDGVIQIARPDQFYRPAHQLLFSVLAEMHGDNKPVDLVTIREELQRRGQLEAVGGIEYVVELVEGVPSAANAEYYARIVRDKALLRELILVGTDAVNEAYQMGAEAEGVLHKMEDRLLTIARGGKTGGISELADAGRELVSELRQREAEGISPTLATGYANIDRILGGGFRAGQLITLAAATSVGKTALAVCVACSIARSGGSVLMVSAEMGADELAQRFVQVHTEMPGSEFDGGFITPSTWERLDKAIVQFDGWAVRIVAKAATPGEIGSLARQAALTWRRKVDLLIVDYCQIMKPPPGIPSRNRERQISAIAEELKQLATSLGTPVLMLAQLNRDHQREKRPPELRGLRESGSLEQHSNVVIFLHRPEAEYLKVSPGSGEHDVWVKVAKNRNGGTTVWCDPESQYANHGMTLRFIPTQTRFAGPDDQQGHLNYT